MEATIRGAFSEKSQTQGLKVGWLFLGSAKKVPKIRDFFEWPVSLIEVYSNHL